MAYCRLDPFGNERGDIHAARSLAQYYNAHRPKGKPEVSAQEFMLDFQSEPESPGDQIVAAFKQLKAMQDNSE